MVTGQVWPGEVLGGGKSHTSPLAPEFSPPGVLTPGVLDSSWQPAARGCHGNLGPHPPTTGSPRGTPFVGWEFGSQWEPTHLPSPSPTPSSQGSLGDRCHHLPQSHPPAATPVRSATPSTPWNHSRASVTQCSRHTLDFRSCPFPGIPITHLPRCQFKVTQNVSSSVHCSVAQSPLLLLCVAWGPLWPYLCGQQGPTPHLCSPTWLGTCSLALMVVRNTWLVST